MTLPPQCTITDEQLISSAGDGRLEYDWERRVRSTHFVLSVNAGHAGSTFFSDRRNYAGAAGSVCFDFEARHELGERTNTSNCPSDGGGSDLRYASDPLPGARHGCGLMGWWKGVARRTFLDSPGRLSLASQNTTYAAFALGRANTVGSSEEASLKLEWVRAQQDAIVRSCGNVARRSDQYTILGVSCQCSCTYRLIGCTVLGVVECMLLFIDGGLIFTPKGLYLPIFVVRTRGGSASELRL